MKLENLHSLLVEELQDLYSAENQIIEALPDMIEEASSPDLKNALQHHLEETRGQVRRLDQIFSQLPNVKKDGKTCKGMKGILKDGQDLLDTDAEPEVLDAGMIEVVGWLVQKKEVWFLDERTRQKKARLLPARKRTDLLIMIGLQVHDVEHAVDLRIDVIHLLRELTLEVFAHGKITLGRRDDLVRHSYGRTWRKEHPTFFRHVLAHDETEQRRLTRAVLAHERDLHTLLQGELGFRKDRMIVPVVKRDVFEAHNRLARAGTGRAVRIRCHIALL